MTIDPIHWVAGASVASSLPAPKSILLGGAPAVVVTVGAAGLRSYFKVRSEPRQIARGKVLSDTREGDCT